MTAGPLAAWDARESSWRCRRPDKQDWLKAAGLDAGTMYRIEFWLADAPFARVFCYALNEEGRPHWNEHHMRNLGRPHDHDACDVAREEPRDVLLEDLPPGELW